MEDFGLVYLQANPRHSSLHTHVFSAFENPFDPAGKVFEAYAQNKTPGAQCVEFLAARGPVACSVSASGLPATAA